MRYRLLNSFIIIYIYIKSPFVQKEKKGRSGSHTGGCYMQAVKISFPDLRLLVSKTVVLGRFESDWPLVIYTPYTGDIRTDKKEADKWYIYLCKYIFYRYFYSSYRDWTLVTLTHCMKNNKKMLNNNFLRGHGISPMKSAYFANTLWDNFKSPTNPVWISLKFKEKVFSHKKNAVTQIVVYFIRTNDWTNTG